MKSAQKCIGSGSVSPLDEARIAMVRDCIEHGSMLVMNADGYGIFADRGMTKAVVDRAVNMLVARGEVTLTYGGFGVVVRPVRSGK